MGQKQSYRLSDSRSLTSKVVGGENGVDVIEFEQKKQIRLLCIKHFATENAKQMLSDMTNLGSDGGTRNSSYSTSSQSHQTDLQSLDLFAMSNEVEQQEPNDNAQIENYAPEQEQKNMVQNDEKSDEELNNDDECTEFASNQKAKEPAVQEISVK